MQVLCVAGLTFSSGTQLTKSLDSEDEDLPWLQCTCADAPRAQELSVASMVRRSHGQSAWLQAKH